MTAFIEVEEERRRKKRNISLSLSRRKRPCTTSSVSATSSPHQTCAPVDNDQHQQEERNDLVKVEAQREKSKEEVRPATPQVISSDDEFPWIDLSCEALDELFDHKDSDQEQQKHAFDAATDAETDDLAQLFTKSPNSPPCASPAVPQRPASPILVDSDDDGFDIDDFFLPSTPTFRRPIDKLPDPDFDMSISESPSPSLQPPSVSTSSNNGNIPVESIASPASPAAPVAVNPTKSGIKRSKVGEDVFTESCVKTWQDSRIKAWEGRHLNPEGYYFRFVIPGEGQQNGGWSSKEHALFMERYEEWVAKGRKMGVAWGLFSRGIPHRVGYQCMNYYRKLLEKKKLKDDAYEVVNGKLKLVQREKSTSHVPIMELGPEWQADDVKEIERNVDQWLAKYHSRSGSVITSRPPPKPKAAPKVVRTTNHHATSSKSSKSSSKGLDIARRLQDQHRFKRQDDFFDDDFDFNSQEPDHPQLSNEKLLMGVEWIERLEKYKAFVELYRNTDVRNKYWVDKQLWRQGLATTEMRLMNRDAQIMQKIFASGGRLKPDEQQQQQSSLSRFFGGVKKVRIDTPDELINIVRIPNDLYSGVKQIMPLSVARHTPSNIRNVYMEVHDMMDCIETLNTIMFQRLPKVSNIEGLLIDPPWEYYVEDGRMDGACTWNLEQMESLLSKVLDQMSTGLIFIWIHKLIQADVVRMMYGLGCKYVENLVWFKKAANNAPVDIPMPYIATTKEILLMFKKGEGIDLRHQRSPDVIIDFEVPLAEWIDEEFTTPKPESVYEMIETLLPEGGYHQELQHGRFVELWTKRANPKREGWIAFHQIKKPKVGPRPILSMIGSSILGSTQLPPAQDDSFTFM